MTESPAANRGAFAAPVLGISGYSGSGKTTLLETVVPIMRGRGLAVAVVKHVGHGFQLDHAGKDSARLYEAGAEVALVGPAAQAILQRMPHGEDTVGLIQFLATRNDLVLVEGFKDAPWPRVWLLSEATSAKIPIPPDVLAVYPRDESRTGQFLAFLDEWLIAAWRSRPLYAGVLIGGRSTRIGQPKHLLDMGGATLLERLVLTLRARVTTIVLVGSGIIPDALKDVPRLPDVDFSSGPLAGMLAANRWAPHARWIMAGCDYAYCNSSALDWLIGQSRPGVWAVLPRRQEHSPPEPLLALYEPQAGTLLEGLARESSRGPAEIAASPKAATPLAPPDLANAWRDIDLPIDYAEARGAIR